MGRIVNVYNYTILLRIPSEHFSFWFGKGQLISECPFDVSNFPKNEKFDKFLPKKSKKVVKS